MLEGDENATIENKGNRDNTCNTTCRVSALGFRPGQVYVNQGEEKEITIIDEDGNQDSWFLDDALDSIPWNEDSPKEVLPHTLANQDDVGEKMIEWLHNRYAGDASHAALMAMGGHNAGKSYTMFGGNVYNYHDRGVVPRLLAEIFNSNSLRAHYLKLSVYLIDGENFVDILVTPPRVYAANECVHNSAALGQVVTNVQEVICTSASEAVELLMKALVSLSMYTVSTVNALHSHHTVVSAQWVGPNAVSAPPSSPIYKILHPEIADGLSLDDDEEEQGSRFHKPKREPATQCYSLLFVEVAGSEYPPIVPSAMDRLSTFGYQFASIRLLLEMAKKCPGSKYLNALNCINHSALTWLLQNSLFHHPDCMIIGCLRPAEAAYQENLATLDYLNRLDVLSDPAALPKESVPLNTLVEKLRNELEGYFKDLGKLRAHIDRASHRLERDEDMCRSLQQSAKAAAAAELAANTSSKGKGNSENVPEAPAPIPDPVPAPEALSMAATDAVALQIDKYKQQYLLLVQKYYYTLDLIRLFESDGRDLLLQRCVADESSGFFASEGAGDSARRGKWVPRELVQVEVSVHACHLYVPPVVEEEEEESGVAAAPRHHHHHHHHHHHDSAPELADHLQPAKDELGRVVHRTHTMKLLEEEKLLGCRRLGVPMCPAADVIANLTYYHLSHGISSNEYSLKMFRHHVNRFSGKLNSRSFVTNQAEVEAAEVQAAVDADMQDLLKDPADEDEDGDVPFDLNAIGRSPSETDPSPSPPAKSPSFAVAPMSAGGADIYKTIMDRCSSSINYVWTRDEAAVAASAGLSSPVQGAPHSPGKRPQTASTVGEVDNDDPYLLPITHFNNSVSQYIQYPLLQGHTVISSSHLLRGERVRCGVAVNMASAREQIDAALAVQENERAVAAGEGEFAVSPLGREFVNLSADPTSVGAGAGFVAASEPAVLHKIPPPMSHVNPHRMRRFHTHGAGTHLHTHSSHLFNEVVVYKFLGDPPAEYLQLQLQRLLCHEYEKRMGISHHAHHEPEPDNCGVATMDELSYYIADPISKRANGGAKKKSIKERVATVVYVPNNHASIPTSAVPEQDSTYCHISRLLDVIKILPISSDISDIGVVLVYVNGMEVTHDMRLHDMDIITITVMSTAIPDAVSCYKFFQVRIPREAQALEHARVKKAERIRKLQQGIVDSDSEEEDGVLEDEDESHHRPKSNNSSRTKSAGMQQVGSPITYHSQFHITDTPGDTDGGQAESRPGTGTGDGNGHTHTHSHSHQHGNHSESDIYENLTDIQVFLGHTGGRFMTLQECALFIMYGHHIVDMLIQGEKGRYHELHQHDVDRHLLPTLKSYETSEMAGLLSYEPDLDWIMNLQSHITWEEKAKICYLLHGASVANFYSDAMQRDQVFKGRCLLLSSTEATVQAGVGSDRTSKTDCVFTIDIDRHFNKAHTVKHGHRYNPGSDSGRKKVAQYDLTATKLMSTKYRRYVFQIQCSTTNDSGSWFWSNHIFQSRFFLMRSMYFDYVDLCQRNFFQLNGLYPNIIDPFVDVPNDEVIGVACVYLNSLYHLVDIDDSFPITNFAGYNSGAIRLSVRAWIDRIETIPSYITVDKEVVLDDFMDRNLIIRININSLQDIPEHLSTGTYVTFKFFYHTKLYSTTRYCGKTTTPMIKCTIPIEQKITADFIESLRTGYIDLEVWGKRGSKANDIESHLSLLSSNELQAASSIAASKNSASVDWHYSAVGSSCVILQRITDHICDIPSDVKVFVDEDGNPLTDDALKQAQEEAEALENNSKAGGAANEDEEDEIMVEEITDPVKLRKNIDALHGQLESFERQLRKLNKATEAAKLEKQQSIHMQASIKTQHAQAEVTIKQQAEEIQGLYDTTDELKKKIDKLEGKKGRCVIS